MQNDDLIFQTNNIGIRRDGTVAFLRHKQEIAAINEIAKEIRRRHVEAEAKESGNE